jgi:hypothetical protein
MRPDAPLLRFVRGLLSGAAGRREGDIFVQPDGRRAAARDILPLIQSGALAGGPNECRRNAETAGWLKRAHLDRDTLQDQHRALIAAPDGARINLAESPLARLAAGANAFLLPHHIEAGERVRRLVERAQIQPRLTMTYSASRTAGRQASTASEITNMAADARRDLAKLHDMLPRDCAGVVMDVCGLLKGLQQVELERRWPRRSAKLVLRIGLDQLATHYGLSAVARGRDATPTRSWSSTT